MPIAPMGVSVIVDTPDVSRSVSFPDTPSSVLLDNSIDEVTRELRLQPHQTVHPMITEGVLSSVFEVDWEDGQHAFVKTPPVHDVLRLLVTSQRLFERERACLRFLAQVDNEQTTSLFAPRILREGRRCFAITHLGDVNFTVLPDGPSNASALLVPLTVPQTKRALVALAEFHAFFFDNSEALETFDDLVDEEQHRSFVMTAFDDGIRDLCTLATSERFDLELVERIIDLKSALKEDNTNMARPPFVIHGDAWSPNIMWREDRVALVDFQWTRRGEPLIDVYYLLYSSLTHDTRREHFDELLQFYVDQLLLRLPESRRAYVTRLLSDDSAHQRAIRHSIMQLIAGGFSMFARGVTDPLSPIEERLHTAVHDLVEALPQGRHYQGQRTTRTAA